MVKAKRCDNTDCKMNVRYWNGMEMKTYCKYSNINRKLCLSYRNYEREKTYTSRW